MIVVWLFIEMRTLFSCELSGTLTIFFFFFFFLLVREVGDVQWVPLLCVWKWTQKNWGRKKKCRSFFPDLRDFRGWRRTDKKTTVCPAPPPPPWSGSDWRPCISIYVFLVLTLDIYTCWFFNCMHPSTTKRSVINCSHLPGFDIFLTKISAWSELFLHYFERSWIKFFAKLASVRPDTNSSWADILTGAFI